MIKPGDIIRWESIGVPTKDMRVVEVWDEGEPKQLLVTNPEDFQAMPKCFIALMADCVKVASGEPPARVKQSKKVDDFWKVPEGCVVGEDR